MIKRIVPFLLSAVILAAWANLGVCASTKRFEENVRWLGEHIRGLRIGDALIAHGGVSQRILYLKTGGTADFRGYYVYQIDPQSAAFNLLSGPEDSDLTIEATGTAKIIREARDMDGEVEISRLTRVVVVCGNSALARQIKEALDGLRIAERPEP